MSKNVLRRVYQGNDDTLMSLFSVMTCFNYLNLSQVASAASGSPLSLWMKLAHLAYLTFVH